MVKQYVEHANVVVHLMDLIVNVPMERLKKKSILLINVDQFWPMVPLQDKDLFVMEEEIVYVENATAILIDPESILRDNFVNR